MNFIKTPIDGLWVIQHAGIEDIRGVFARTFCKSDFAKIGFNIEFVQFNYSFNNRKGTVRGVHYQSPPYAESKLIRCVQGSVYDVAVDIRQDSPTFLKHFGVELSAANLCSILIPEGFAHGFQTLEDSSSLIYHHTAYYNPAMEAGLRYNDVRLNIGWPLPCLNLSEKDLSYPLINENFNGIYV
jgi:dTDP-4-dehydrorhamnose 3,5-epimerase